MRSVGRGLQVFALGLPLLGLVYGLDGGKNAMSLELGFLASGVALFLLGRRFEKGSGSA